MIKHTDIEIFKATIWRYHAEHRRAFVWRDEISPYRVVVSEIMLQQTQASRVKEKFEPFIDAFPDFLALACAPFHDVLKLWKGLGYNRRALALQKSAQIVVQSYGQNLPKEPQLLEALPGIGKATASSIVAFAFNLPTVFIETNIRTVFIHAFFNDRSDIHDRELLPLVACSVDIKAPREWYYALMDYGVMLKKTVGNKSRQSSHYHRQSPFIGSDRELRGMILQALIDNHLLSPTTLAVFLNKESTRVERMLKDLCTEGLVSDKAGILTIGS